MLESQTHFNQVQSIESMQRYLIRKNKNHQKIKYIRTLHILSIPRSPKWAHPNFPVSPKVNLLFHLRQSSLSPLLLLMWSPPSLLPQPPIPIKYCPFPSYLDFSLLQHLCPLLNNQVLFLLFYLTIVYASQLYFYNCILTIKHYSYYFMLLYIVYVSQL